MNDRQFLEQLMTELKTIEYVHDVILFEELQGYNFPENSLVIMLDTGDSNNISLGSKMEMDFNIYTCFKNEKGYSSLYEFDAVLREGIPKNTNFNVYFGKSSRPRFDNKYKVWTRVVKVKFKY